MTPLRYKAGKIIEGRSVTLEGLFPKTITAYGSCHHGLLITHVQF